MLVIAFQKHPVSFMCNCHVELSMQSRQCPMSKVRICIRMETPFCCQCRWHPVMRTLLLRHHDECVRCQIKTQICKTTNGYTCCVISFCLQERWFHQHDIFPDSRVQVHSIAMFILKPSAVTVNVQDSHCLKHKCACCKEALFEDDLPFIKLKESNADAVSFHDLPLLFGSDHHVVLSGNGSTLNKVMSW